MILSAYCEESWLAGDLMLDIIKYLLSVVTIHKIFKSSIQLNFPMLPSQIVIRKLGKVKMFHKVLFLLHVKCRLQFVVVYLSNYFAKVLSEWMRTLNRNVLLVNNALVWCEYVT